LSDKVEFIGENSARGDILLERILNSGTQMLLQRSMDVSSLRNEVIANNMANVDTPGFKRNEVIFEDKIKSAMAGSNNDCKLNITNSRHIQIQADSSQVDPEIRTMNDLTYRNDGNNVDIDVETAKMTKNKLYYDALGQSMSNELKMLRIAFTGRR
jgi:flagellar basal-body rod protein FlgB